MLAHLSSEYKPLYPLIPYKQLQIGDPTSSCPMYSTPVLAFPNSHAGSADPNTAAEIDPSDPETHHKTVPHILFPLLCSMAPHHTPEMPTFFFL